MGRRVYLSFSEVHTRIQGYYYPQVLCKQVPIRDGYPGISIPMVCLKSDRYLHGYVQYFRLKRVLSVPRKLYLRVVSNRNPSAPHSSATSSIASLVDIT